MINIIDYGAVGDGVTDCYDAFQRAENTLLMEGGEIFVPAGRYKVSQSFFHWSGITLSGEGADSVIFNDAPAEGGSDVNFCIQVGNFKPTSFARCTHYKVRDINAGQDFVRFNKAMDMNIFTVGECILIDSINGFVGHNGDFKPYHAFINRVSYIDRTQNVLYLEDKIPDSVIGAKVARAKNDNPKDYICQFPVLRNISFESNGDWTLRWGCYKGTFENLWIKSTDIIGGNGLSHCMFKNIVAKFSQKVIEMATYSHNSTVDGLVAKWYNGYKDPDPKPLIAMGENVRNCIYKNLNIDSGNMKNIGMAARFEHGFGNKIFDSSFTIGDIGGGCALELSTTDSSSIVTGNEISNSKFVVSNARAFVKIDIGDSTATMVSNAVTGNTFKGVVRRNEMGNAVSQNRIDNNTYN